MTPFEILQLTHKNNCGKCGQPTCLAFAAAVVTSNYPPAKCPFIAPEKLQNIKTKSSGMAPADEKDLALVTHLKNKIAELDFAKIHQPLGANWNDSEPDTLRFLYLGQHVSLDSKGVIIDGREPEDPRDLILLYNYIHSCGGREPNGGWVGMESLPNSISKVKTLSVYCEERLARLFTETSEEDLSELIKMLNAKPIETTSATFSIIVPVLPKIPLQVLFWEEEPDDGFEAKVKVLFDQHVMDFLDLESLVFAAERLADRAKKVIK